MRLHNTTISGNTANVSGGGLENGGTLTLHTSTISNNTAVDRGGGLAPDDGRLEFRNSIIVGNTVAAGGRGPDCWAQVIPTSLGHNLVGTDTGCSSEPSLGDLTVDPATVFTQVLGPLQDNGGPTFTHALLPGSPAIDAGDPDKCPPKDQRSVPRPQGAGCDIGAFELEAP
jgi:hypothetical protein